VYQGSKRSCPFGRQLLTNLCFQQFYIAVDRLIKPNRSAIMAITSKMWIRLPTDVKNTPIAHPIIRMTAIIYRSEFMIIVLINDFHRY
jgi:hypothetical protein